MNKKFFIIMISILIFPMISEARGYSRYRRNYYRGFFEIAKEYNRQQAEEDIKHEIKMEKMKAELYQIRERNRKTIEYKKKKEAEENYREFLRRNQKNRTNI